MAVQDAHGDDVECEEGAHGDQVEQAVEGREQRDDGCAADTTTVRDMKPDNSSAFSALSDILQDDAQRRCCPAC